MVSRAWHWIRDHPHVISSLILGVGLVVSLAIDHAQDVREQHEDEREEIETAEARVDLAEREARNGCLSGNNSRAAIREIGVDLAVANAEALIAVAEDPDPAAVQEYRRIALANAEQTVSILPDRDCEAAAREARQEAVVAEGLEPEGDQ